MAVPTSYSEALAQAAALQGASISVDDRIRQMSERTIAARESAADWAIRMIEQSWVFVDPYDGEQVAAFAAKAAQLMQSAQVAVSRVTSAAQAQQLVAMGVRVPTAVPTAPLDVRVPSVDISGGVVELQPDTSTVDYGNKRVRVTVKDSTTEEVFNRPAREYRYQRSRGQSHEDAQQSAKSRVRVIVNDNLMLAQRIAEAETIAQAADLDKTVTGYRRIVHPELSRGGSCGMCIVASDRKYHVSELKPIHANCNCTVAAITEDFDPGSVNDVDLRTFYKDAKGNTVQDLKRTRYQVDEHGELGAVLVPKAKHRSQAERARDRAEKKAKKTSASGG